MDSYDLTEDERTQLGRMYAAAGRIWWNCRVVFPWLPGETGRTLCVLGDGLPILIANRVGEDVWEIVRVAYGRLEGLETGTIVMLSHMADTMERLVEWEDRPW
jgi:hypothetical protein